MAEAPEQVDLRVAEDVTSQWDVCMQEQTEQFCCRDGETSKEYNKLKHLADCSLKRKREDGTTISLKSHKQMLSRVSEVFRNLVMDCPDDYDFGMLDGDSLEECAIFIKHVYAGAHSDRKVLSGEVPSALTMARKYDCPGLEAAAERTVAQFALDFTNLLDFLTVTDRYKRSAEARH